jgi:hypothetical protein
MRVGQTEHVAPPPLKELLKGNPPSLVVNLVEVSLFQTEPERVEVFPPSKGEVALSPGRIACRKQRTERVTIPQMAQTPCLVSPDQIVLDSPGWQYLAFDLIKVSQTRRTMLKDHLVVVEDEEGFYELVLGGGSPAERIVERIDRLRKIDDDGD